MAPTMYDIIVHVLIIKHVPPEPCFLLNPSVDGKTKLMNLKIQKSDQCLEKVMTPSDTLKTLSDSVHVLSWKCL